MVLLRSHLLALSEILIECETCPLSWMYLSDQVMSYTISPKVSNFLVIRISLFGPAFFFPAQHLRNIWLKSESSMFVAIVYAKVR